MTCIVGVRCEGGRVLLGGDLGGFAGWNHAPRRDPKVFARPDGMAIGFTSSYRMGDLLRYSLKFDAPGEGESIDRWARTTFVDAVRKCFSEGGFLTKDKEQEAGGQFLVGYRGRLFAVGGDFQVGEPRVGFDSVGVGKNVALGALHVLGADGRPSVKQAKRIARDALGASEMFCGGVRGPYRFAVSEG